MAEALGAAQTFAQMSERRAGANVGWRPIADIVGKVRLWKQQMPCDAGSAGPLAAQMNQSAREATMVSRLLVALAISLALTSAAAADDIVEINGWRLDGGPVFVDFRDPASAVEQLNEALIRNNKKGTVISCGLFTEIRLGKMETSYAGTCSLKQTKRTIEIHICYDTGIGEFALEPVIRGIDPRASLIQFAFDHCGGG